MMVLATTAWMYISNALIFISILAVMPTLVVWICMKKRNEKYDRQIELAKSAIEKDPSLNLEDFLAKLTPAKRTYAQKSVSLILISSTLLFLGLAATAIAFVFNSRGIDEGFAFFGIIACILLALGFAFLVSFLYTRKLVYKGLLK